MTIQIFREIPLSILERVDISWASHIHPSQKLWPLEFVEHCRVQFQAPDILCAWIGDSSKMLWPFEFLKSLRCSFSSVLLYHGPHTYTRVKIYGRLSLSRAFVFNFDRLDILCAWIGHLCEILLPFIFLESLRCSFSSILIYHGPQTYTRVKSYGRLNLSRAFEFNFDRLDILCAWIGHPSATLLPFEFLESLHCSFSSVSIYHGPHTYTRLKSYGRLNFLRASVYNFKSIDILWAWIGHHCEKLRPFEFLESLHCSFSSVSIYHGPHTYTRVKSYCRLNLPRTLGLSFMRLDILCAWIGHSSEMLWPFEFLESLRCSLYRISIYHGPHTYTRVKIYGCLNLLRAYVFNSERLDILCSWIGHPSERLWPFEFLESFLCSFSCVSIYHGPHTYTRVKSYGCLNVLRACVFNFQRLDILCS